MRATVESYFAALADRDFATACSAVSSSFRKELAAWSVRNQPELGSRDCPTIARRIAQAADDRLVGLQRDVRVRSVEVDGERATARLGPGQMAALRLSDGDWQIDRLDFRGATG